MLVDSLEILDMSGNKKEFFSDRFNLSLNFHNNGGITGILYPFAEFKTISGKVVGLYQKINAIIALTFLCEYSDPNLTSKSLITFSGKILRYEKENECLILKWLMIQDNIGCEIVDRDIEILLDSKHTDEQRETIKVKAHLNKYAMQVFS